MPGAGEVRGFRPSAASRVSQSALAEVLRSCDAGNIKVVVLNACHSSSLADAIGESIDCVVSMDQEISDSSAIKFAASFYGATGLRAARFKLPLTRQSRV